MYKKLMEMPEYLDSNQVLSDFYISYAGSVIQLIAKLNYDKEKLYENQLTLVQLMEVNSVIIFNNSEILRQVEKQLNEEDLKEDIIDSLQNYRSIIIQNIRSLVQYNNNAFQVLESTLANDVDLLNIQNQSNHGNEIYEINEKIVNEVLFSSVAINELSNVFNHASEILNVAVQCPLAGGPAVYRARSLYFIIDPDRQYDDINTCLQEGYLYRRSKNVTRKSKLFPNPASKEITIEISITDKSKFQILDGLGRIVKEYSISQNEISITFSVQDIADGIYNYRVIDKTGNMNDVGRFVVNKQ